MGRHGSNVTGETPSGFVAMKAYDEAAEADMDGARSRCPVLAVGVGRADADGDSKRSHTPKANGMLNAMATRIARTAIVRVAEAVRIVTHGVSTRLESFLTIVTRSRGAGAGQTALNTAGCARTLTVDR